MRVREGATKNLKNMRGCNLKSEENEREREGVISTYLNPHSPSRGEDLNK